VSDLFALSPSMKVHLVPEAQAALRAPRALCGISVTLRPGQWIFPFESVTGGVTCLRCAQKAAYRDRPAPADPHGTPETP
jgi:hypothetical protein